MPIILSLLAIAAAAFFWINRARNAAQATQDLMGVANDVRAAARRFGFQRQSAIHPVDAIEDPKVAIGALAAAFLELDSFPTSDQKTAMISSLREQLNVSHDDAEELAILGRWIMSECGGAEPAIARLSRKLFKLSGQDYFDPLMNVIKMIAKFGQHGLSAKQKTALEDLKHGLKIQ